MRHLVANNSNKNIARNSISPIKGQSFSTTVNSSGSTINSISVAMPIFQGDGSVTNLIAQSVDPLVLPTRSYPISAHRLHFLNV